ncbi:hypothetical protein NQ317_006753 [Molorchus minor]|uniref:Uncharacterized protein n=1 Tax=Molorchus minor TaxID=1323400 RepID=A0ABQ9JKP3_9CUCU|nr:hypothetical protein NQ317_006753 [Molorchus minor]
MSTPDSSGIFPIFPEHCLPKPKTTVSKETISTIPEMIRALPTLPESSRIFPILPELSRRLETPCLVRGIDCDYSRNDPSPPDISRIFPMPKTTVFDTQGIDCDYSWNDPSTPDFSRIFPIFSELSRTLETPCLVRGIDCDYSRNDPSTPDFSRTLPKPKTTVFGVFAHIFRCEESIATIPETIRALPIFPELSRRLETPCLVSFIIFSGTRNRLFPKRYENSQTWQLPPFFPNRQTSDRLSASKIFSKREDAWPQATPLAAKLPPGQRSCPRAAQPPPPASQS